MNTALAPIVLFVYNRPEHTLRTLESLKLNEESKQSTLFIFCDGPKANANDEQLKNIEATRKIVRKENWCKIVEIKESENNKGLANSIIYGVTKIVNEYEKIIVLEDDLLLSPYFLKYMNEALDLYQNDDEVISIHGYLYPVKEQLPETFFLKGADCWGWATWKRGWDLFETDGRKLLKEIRDKKLRHEFDYNGSYPNMKMLVKQIAGENDSWAIRWYASAFLKNKLTLYPGRSLVKNIGAEGSGIHTAKTDAYETKVAQTPINLNKTPTIINRLAFDNFRRYFESIKPSFFQKILYQFKK